jgi:cytochrome c oxidase cbb3-type subunit 3
VINENNVKLITDKTQLEAAQKIFRSICFACHGPNGEGTIGPNLTDDYWIHGGGIKNIFHTITYGYPEKGMQSWKATYTPLQINQLASYVISLRGTNPPNPKEKQGELYVEEGTGTAPVATKDSLNTGAK